MSNLMDFYLWAFCLIGAFHTVSIIISRIWPQSKIGQFFNPTPPPSPPLIPPSSTCEYKSDNEQRLRMLENILSEDRRARANPSEMVVTATVQPRYRTRANSSVEGSGGSAH
jgi:hypothetical protein